MILDHLDKLNSFCELETTPHILPVYAYDTDNVHYSYDGNFKYISKHISYEQPANAMENNLIIERKDERGVFQQIQEIPDTYSPKHSRQGYCVVTTSDGFRLFVSHHDEFRGNVKSVGCVRVYDFNHLTELYELTETIESPLGDGVSHYFGTGIAVSPDGTLLVVTSHIGAGTFYTYKLNADGGYDLLRSNQPISGSVSGGNYIFLDGDVLFVSSFSNAGATKSGQIDSYLILDNGTLAYKDSIHPNSPVVNGYFGHSLGFDHITRTIYSGFKLESSEYHLLREDNNGKWHQVKILDAGNCGTALTRTFANTYPGKITFSGDTIEMINRLNLEVDLTLLNEPPKTTVCGIIPTIIDDKLQICGQPTITDFVLESHLYLTENGTGYFFGLDLAISDDSRVLYVIERDVTTDIHRRRISRYVRDADLKWVYSFSFETNTHISAQRNFLMTTNVDGSMLYIGGMSADLISVYGITDDSVDIVENIPVPEGMSSLYFGQGIALSQCGTKLIAGVSLAGGTTQLVMLRKTDGVWGKVAEYVPIPNRYGLAITMSPDGNYLLVGYTNAVQSMVRLFKIETQFSYLRDFTSSVVGFGDSLSFGRDHRELFIGADHSTGYVTRYKQNQDGVYVSGTVFAAGKSGGGMEYDPQTDTLLVADYDDPDNGEHGSVSIYDLDEHTVTDIITPRIRNQIRSFGKAVSVSNDGLWSAVGSYVNNDGAKTGMVSIFKRVGNEYVHTQDLMESPATVNTFFGERVRFSPDGTKLLVGNHRFSSNTGKLTLFDLVDDEWVFNSTITSPVGSGRAFGAAFDFSDDNRELFVTYHNAASNLTGNIIVCRFTYNDQTGLYVYDSFNHSTLDVLPSGGNTHAMSVSGDGEWLVLTGGKTTVVSFYRRRISEVRYTHIKTFTMPAIGGNLHDATAVITSDGMDAFITATLSVSDETQIHHFRRNGTVWYHVSTIGSDYGHTPQFDSPTLSMSKDGKAVILGLGTSTNGVDIRKDSASLPPKVFMIEPPKVKPTYSNSEPIAEMSDFSTSETLIPISL